MEIIRSGGKVKKTTFGKLEEGDAFRDEDAEQVKIKTDEAGGCCLENGVITSYGEEEIVIPIACELHIIK